MVEFKAILNLGSNLGNKAKNLNIAIKLISKNCQVLKVSRVYASDSLLMDEQDRYFNISILIKTKFSPLELLEFLKNIERKMGRKDRGRWKERVIDIDIIDFNKEGFEEATLKIPHYDMANRSFFLYPTLEVYPDYTHPVTNKSLYDMIKSLRNDYNIKMLGELKWR